MSTNKQEVELLHADNNNVQTMHVSLDNPGHDYDIYALNGTDDKPNDQHLAEIHFQNGPVKANGVNGITSEALLSILIHRTDVLNGNFPCAENETALMHLRGALEAFESRTKNRISRGVEGENKL